LARKAALRWGLVVVLISLTVALAVYDLARAFPPRILEPFQLTDRILAMPGWLSGSAPSFLYTFSFGLLIGGAAAPTQAVRHCLIWTAVALGFELVQLPALATRFGSWLADVLPDALSGLVASYWTAGTFDVGDLAATAAAGLLVLFIIRRLAIGAPR
jgi:hypothetical protein